MERGVNYMWKFINNTTKENFLENIEWSGNKIERIQIPFKRPKLWQISDRFGNVWEVLFKGDVGEYSISNVCRYPSDKPFTVDIISNGNKVEIHKAIKNRRNIKSDRLLKQFSQIAMMVNCYVQFVYLK